MAGDPIALKARILGSAKPDAATAVDGHRADRRRLPRPGPRPAVGQGADRRVPGRLDDGRLDRGRVRALAATDDRSGVGAYGLQARTGQRAWTTVPPRPAVERNRACACRREMASRVRARDGAGNWVPWSPATTVTPVRYQETTSRRPGTGRGTIRHEPRRPAGPAATRPARARPSRSGSPAGPSGSSRRRDRAGAARSLYVDGAYVSTIDLHRSSWTPRVMSRHGHGRRRERTASVSSRSGRAATPRIDVDAFLVLR